MLSVERGERMKEERVHGFLLILNELVRCSNADWERRCKSLLERTDTKQTVETSFNFTKSRFVFSVSRRVPQYQAVSLAPSQIAIIESQICRQLVAEKFDYICLDVLAQRLSRSSHIQQTFLTILPRLAAFDRENFVKQHLSPVMNHIFNILKSREKERAKAFVTIGLIAIAVEDHIENYIEKIMEIIRMYLPRGDILGRKRTAIDSSIFNCVTFLAHALKDHTKMDVPNLLEPMLTTGLTASLTICLRELSRKVPEHKEKISLGLLKMLSYILLNKPLVHPGMPRHLTGTVMSLAIPEVNDVQIIVLALKTLGTFDFEGQRLLPFVHRCANHFLVHDNSEIRLEAVRTTCRLLRHAIHSTAKTSSETVTKTVAAVLHRLLSVGLTDTDPNVRYGVLISLDRTFDGHLAQAESLSALFVALQDEMFEIREVALFTIGRLSAMNPAYVMPSLRKTLVQLLSELEHSGSGRNKEQGARMLDHLVVSAPRMIRPYMEPILKVKKILILWDNHTDFFTF